MQEKLVQLLITISVIVDDNATEDETRRKAADIILKGVREQGVWVSISKSEVK